MKLDRKYQKSQKDQWESIIIKKKRKLEKQNLENEEESSCEEDPDSEGVFDSSTSFWSRIKINFKIFSRKIKDKL